MKKQTLAIIFILFSLSMHAQDKTVLFKITDKDNKPISGAVVWFKDTPLYTTGPNGLAPITRKKFDLKTFFLVSCNGYQTRSKIHVNPFSSDTLRMPIILVRD